MGSLWNRSGTIERYADDLRAAGAKAYFYQGGTTTALTVYQDAGEASAHPNPVVADSHGRWPDIFVPYTLSYDVQVKTAEGVQLTFSLAIPNPDPIDLSVTVPAESQVSTGMIHPELGNTTKTGYVRLNGLTIGNASSSATERANADTSSLFTYLYNRLSDTIAPVSGGRTSVAADYAANKTITLPSLQGAILAGLDDMGNVAAGAFAGLTFTAGTATTAGAILGENGIAITEAQMPAHAHAGSTSPNGAHTPTATTGFTGSQSIAHTHGAGSYGADSGGSHGHGVTQSDHSHPTDHVSISGGGGAGLVGGALATSTSTGGAQANISIDSGGSHSHSISGTSGSASSTAHTHSITMDAVAAHSHTFTTDSKGNGDAVNNLPITRLVTWYIKL